MIIRVSEKKPTIQKDPNTMYVSIKNFGIIKSANIALEPGMTILRGPSGSGKSTLMRAIEDTIYNTPGDTTITNGETLQAVKIEYNGHTIIRRKDLNSRSDKTLYQVDGTIYGKLGRQPMQEVLELLNMEELKPLDSRVRLSFVSQFAPPFLVRESPPKVFETLTTTDQVDLPSILRQMRSDADELQIQRKTLEASHNATTRAMMRDRQTSEHLASVPQRIEQLQRLQPKELRVVSLTELLSRREQALNEGRTTQQKLNGLPYLPKPQDPERLNNLNKLVSPTYRLHKEIPEGERKLSQLNDLIKGIESVPEPPTAKANKLSRLNDLLSHREKIKAQATKIKETTQTDIPDPAHTEARLTQLQKLLTETTELDTQIKQLTTDSEAANEQLTQTESELSKFDTCPLCHQPLKKGEHLNGTSHQ